MRDGRRSSFAETCTEFCPEPSRMRVGAGLEIYFAPFNDGVDEVLLWTIMGLAQSLRVGAENTLNYSIDLSTVRVKRSGKLPTTTVAATELFPGVKRFPEMGTRTGVKTGVLCYGATTVLHDCRTLVRPAGDTQSYWSSSGIGRHFLFRDRDFSRPANTHEARIFSGEQ